MISSEKLDRFYDHLRSKQVPRAECIAAVDEFIADQRYIEAIYVLDRALVCFPSSRYLNKRITELLDEKFYSATLVDGIFEHDVDTRILDTYNKIKNRFTSIHGNEPDDERNNSFLVCVILKNMCMSMNRNQPIWYAALRMAEYFGARAASDAFGDSTASSVMISGISKIKIGKATLRFHVSNHFLEFGLRYFFVHEPGMLRFISKFQKSDVFLDIGANIGSFTIVAAATIGCRTFAIEPFSANYEELLRNISLNGVNDRVVPLRIAISDVTDEGSLSFKSMFAGAASQAFDEGDEGTTERIQGYRLDDLIAEGKIDFPNHIKIDVDGAEHRIIAGMPDTLSDSRLRSIRLEIRVEDPRNAEALRMIEAAGFSWRVDDDLKNILCLRI